MRWLEQATCYSAHRFGVTQGRSHHHWLLMFAKFDTSAPLLILPKWKKCWSTCVFTRRQWRCLCDQAAGTSRLVRNVYSWSTFLSRNFKKCQMTACSLWSRSNESTAARLSRERACTYPAIVYTASFLLHLSTLCPLVPSLPPVSADPRISSLDGYFLHLEKNSNSETIDFIFFFYFCNFNLSEMVKL